jgi:hypothetical protein
MTYQDLTAREKRIKYGNIRENRERECGYCFRGPERSNGIKKTAGGNFRLSPDFQASGPFAVCCIRIVDHDIP